MRQSLFALYLLLVLVPAPAFAWGGKGHRFVARIAFRYLDDRTQNLLSGILAGDTDTSCASATTLEDKMACVSTWADDVRRDRTQTANWHFTDISIIDESFDTARDCRPTPKGDCSILAISRFRALMVDNSATPLQRAEALKFLIHFIGDLHQPLHDADDSDLGGNSKHVTWFGEKTNTAFKTDWNLHSVWDEAIIAHAGKDEPTYLTDLVADLPAFQLPLTIDLAKLQAGSVVSWANDGHDIARDHSYGTLPAQDPNDPVTVSGDKTFRFHLADEYHTANEPLVQQQLRLGGIRLARVLRETLRPVM